MSIEECDDDENNGDLYTMCIEEEDDDGDNDDEILIIKNMIKNRKLQVTELLKFDSKHIPRRGLSSFKNFRI
jgi:hypothetical protein